MGRCIYLKKSEPEVSFNSADHIIPAGIGGVKKLDYGTVSDQFNTGIFSSLELDFMRNSMISLPRQFLGPGKRGSLSLSKASKSNIHVMFKNDNKSDASLGYIKLGKPHQIPQLILIGEKEVRLIFDANDGENQQQLQQFISSLQNFNGKYIVLYEKDLPAEQIIIGTYDNKWFVATRDSIDSSKVNKIIQCICSQGIEVKGTPTYCTSQVRSYQSMSFNIDYFFRVNAKIAFNFLTYCRGPDYVLKEMFDPIRSWIVQGGDNAFATLMDSSNILLFKQFPFPGDSHKIFLMKIDTKLLCLLSFYGNHFVTSICLCDDFSEMYELDGLICDWRNRQEYSLLEYLRFVCS